MKKSQTTQNVLIRQAHAFTAAETMLAMGKVWKKVKLKQKRTIEDNRLHLEIIAPFFFFDN